MRILCLCLLWWGIAVPKAADIITINGSPDPELHKAILQSVDFIYRESFQEADKQIRWIQKKYSKHPIGPFLKAAAIDARMVYYFSSVEESALMKSCDKAIDLGEKMLRKNKGDKWTAFFVGGAYGYKGTFQARYKKYLTAFRNGWQGVSMLKTLHTSHPDFYDIYLGLGTYHYWSSKFSRLLWWMPGLEDKRSEGIKQLKRVVEDGLYTKEVAAINLIAIYLEEKDYSAAISLSEQMLKRFPQTRLFSFSLAQALFFSGKHSRAEELFRRILDRCDAAKHNNYVYPLKCRSYLARIFQARKADFQAAAECRRALEYAFSKMDAIAVEEELKTVKEVLALTVAKIPEK